MIRDSALLAEELTDNFVFFEKRQGNIASPQLDAADYTLFLLADTSG